MATGSAAEVFDPTSRVALVTGAARGIGAPTSRTRAKRGAAVEVNDLNRDHAKASADGIREAGWVNGHSLVINGGGTR